jgi:glucose-6-phosphate isomerase
MSASSIPDDIGGRYSVQTAVGLFPIACAGIDPREILAGSAACREDCADPSLETNQAYRYAVIRREMYAHYHKAVEMFITYVPGFVQIGEWWKQLYGESEGKDKKGLLPDSATFTTDLHSLGQFIQDGSPVFFETTLHLSHHRHDVKVPHDEENLDGLNYLEGRSLATSKTGLSKARFRPTPKSRRTTTSSSSSRRWMPGIWAISSTSLNGRARCRLTSMR